MKYKLINSITKEETICDKVTIDGYDYYVSDEKNFKEQEICIYGKSLFLIENISHKDGPFRHLDPKMEINGKFIKNMSFCKFDSLQPFCKLVANNNPNIDDVPKVVDEVERLANEFGYHDQKSDTLFREGLILGYNKSQETHQYSASDMVEFADWIDNNSYFQSTGKWFFNNFEDMDKDATLIASNTQELLQLWKEQKPKTLYYE